MACSALRNYVEIYNVRSLCNVSFLKGERETIGDSIWIFIIEVYEDLIVQRRKHLILMYWLSELLYCYPGLVLVLHCEEPWYYSEDLCFWSVASLHVHINKRTETHLRSVMPLLYFELDNEKFSSIFLCIFKYIVYGKQQWAKPFKVIWAHPGKYTFWAGQCQYNALFLISLCSCFSFVEAFDVVRVRSRFSHKIMYIFIS